MVVRDRITRHGVCVCLSALVWCTGSGARGEYPTMQLRRLGLYGPDNTGLPPTGYQTTSMNAVVVPVREVVGFSSRAGGGIDTWVWTPTLGHSVSIGLTGAEHTGGAGYRYSAPMGVNQSGQVAGITSLVKDLSTAVGQDAWVWSAALGGTQVIGLVDAEHTDALGYRSSDIRMQHHNGFVIGASGRYTAGGGSNGADVWVWRPGFGTLPIGLTGPGFTGSSGYQSSGAQQIVNGASLVLGVTDQISGVSTKIGQSQWVWGAANGTVELGFTGPDYTKSNGGTTSLMAQFTDSGLIGGRTARALGSQQNGWDAWVWSPAWGGVVRVGLDDPAYTGTSGYRLTGLTYFTPGGQLFGSTYRILGASTLNGSNPWVWSASLGTTVRVGLFDSDHTDPTGKQDSSLSTSSGTETQAGTSKRYSLLGADLGTDAWAWDPVAQSVMQIGLATADHARSDGYRSQSIRGVHVDGLVKGIAKRYTAGDTDNGQSAWAWSAALGSTVEVGLAGGAFEGPGGYRYSEHFGFAGAVEVTGFARRYDAMGNDWGRAVWVWDSSMGTVRIGMFDAEHTSADGRQYSTQTNDTATGIPYGTSEQYATDGTMGASAWVADPDTGVTTRMGLIDVDHTGFGGIRSSAVQESSAGSRYIMGNSTRYSPGAGADIGRDAWWFDRVTGLTENPMSGVAGAVRLSDGYGWSEGEYVSDDGTMVGSYLFFDGGVGSGVSHLFLYRPGLGFADLDSLVPGGMAASNCAELYGLTYDTAPDLFVATGVAIGQTSGESAFVAIPVDCAGDITGDGATNASDFNVVVSHFGETVEPFMDGDITGDGVVNSADFNFIASNFGCGSA